MSDVTVITTVKMDEKIREYRGQAPTLSKARFLSEKKARALLRRYGLSVKMDNVVKKRCPDCPERTEIEVHDLPVPKKVDELDDFDWMLEDNYYM